MALRQSDMDHLTTLRKELEISKSRSKSLESRVEEATQEKDIMLTMLKNQDDKSKQDHQQNLKDKAKIEDLKRRVLELESQQEKLQVCVFVKVYATEIFCINSQKEAP